MKSKNTIRKNLDLPMKTVKELERCGKSFRMKVKPYMELILIDYADGRKESSKTKK